MDAMTTMTMSRQRVYKRRRNGGYASNPAASIEEHINEISGNKFTRRLSYIKTASMSSQVASKEREPELAKFSKQVRALERKLEETSDVQKSKFKWEWSKKAMSIVEQLRDSQQIRGEELGDGQEQPGRPSPQVAGREV
jgi:hypothetical protein